RSRDRSRRWRDCGRSAAWDTGSLRFVRTIAVLRRNCLLHLSRRSRIHPTSLFSKFNSGKPELNGRGEPSSWLETNSTKQHPSVPNGCDCQAATHSAVIVRLDRTIQYSRDAGHRAETPLEYWMPRMRGA